MRDDAIKLDALIRLGIARQAKLDEQSQEVYLDDLEDEPSDVVAEACVNLRRAQRAEYETAFPALGTILAECKRVRVARQRAYVKALAAQAPKLLTACDETPLTPEESKAFVNNIKARVLQLRKGVAS